MAAYKLLMMVGLAALAPAWLPAPESQQKLAMSAVRFYRPDVKQTQVKAFIEIPYMMLEPSGEAADARVTYHVTVQVKDSTGLELVRNTWDSHAAAGMRQPGASALEILDFALAPGRYVVMVEVSDPVSGRKLDAELPIEGFRSEPEISDLLLAPKIRAAGAADTVPAPGEIRRDRLLITGSAGLILTPLRSKAFYLIETYNKKQDSIRIAMSVKDSTGKALISTPPTVTQLPVGGGGLTGALDLTGLPAGEYQLVAELTLEGRTVQRSAGFTMAPLSETLAKDVVRREANRVTDAGYFSEMSEREVDAAAAPLSLIASSQELSAYNKKLSLQAKRRFLSEFWSRRDPAPDTPRNEMREQFYAAIAYADEHFKEGGRATAPGWRTDRGRVYARHGLPDETLDRQQQGTAPPYQVWRYSKGKGQYYIFADRTGFGAYTLLSSNDLKEAGIPAWQRTLGLQAVQDIARFLNVDQIVLDPGTNF